MEIWKDIEGYEGLYQVSNLGNIKSLSRIVLNRGKAPFLSKEKILRGGYSKSEGYLTVCLRKNNINKTYRKHQLVAISFLNHIPCGYNLVINHINFDKTDNRVDNLEIVTNRENSNKKHIKSSSQYVGVVRHKKRKEWRAQIYLNGKLKYLGSFQNELDAHNAYQFELLKSAN